MIITKIQGGLGNQMFQWAYGRMLSIKYNKKLFVDRSFYLHQGSLVRYFNLDKFNIKVSDLDTPYIQEFGKRTVKVISDHSYYIDHILNNDENYYLDGYWQSEKFFNEVQEQIFEDFTYSSIKLDSVEKEIDFANNMSISLHVRRGDYVGSEETYPVQSLEYYKNAVDKIGQYDKLLIFSDDISWCEDNFNFDNMIFSRGFDNVEDMTLMSKCHHNIIANSSFSWWGAYLNKNVNKKVIAPSLWYGPKMNIETKDLIPESWIKI
jgi:hypothetical protein